MGLTIDTKQLLFIVSIVSTKTVTETPHSGILKSSK